MSTIPTSLQQTNVIYKFQCPLPHSQAAEYVGLTQTSLSRRLTMHGQGGSVYNHFMELHNKKPTREELTHNTTIIARAPDRYRLAIKEALLILKHAPAINKQYDNFSNILKLHNHRGTKSQNTPLPIPTLDPPAYCLDPPLHPFSENPSTFSSSSLSPCLTHSPPFLQTPAPSLTQNSIVLPPVTTTTYPYPDPIDYNQTSSPLQQTCSNPSHPSFMCNIPQSTPNTKVTPVSPPSTIDIPDMHDILNRFGINPANFNTVPLKSYHWLNFITLKRSPSPDPQTISQRVRSLIREARPGNNTHNTSAKLQKTEVLLCSLFLL